MARPPWSWFDKNSRDQSLGLWFFDPATIIKRDFQKRRIVQHCIPATAFLGKKLSSYCTRGLIDEYFTQVWTSNYGDTDCVGCGGSFVNGRRAKLRASMTGPILFHLAAVTCIFLGIVRKKNEAGGELSFKNSVKTGLGISLVYAATSCLFFVILYFVMGPTFSSIEPMAQNRPLWQVAVIAYTGLFFGSLIFGLIYSTVISMFLAKRRSQTN